MPRRVLLVLTPFPPTVRRLTAAVLALAIPLGLCASVGISSSASAAVCDPASGNAVSCENARPGTPSAEWDISGAGDATIQGFATDMSVEPGKIIDFKIKTVALGYTIDIYRLGWYGGAGARKVATLRPTAVLPQRQPACLSDPTTLLYDCGQWGVSASWTVPGDAVSGVYLARPARADTGGASHIPFVVRAPLSRSDIVFQTADTTWQAYNDYGGASLYPGPLGQAKKVSYNRPFATRDGLEKRDFLFANEYPMIRFLERNGYDVSYMSGIDADRHGASIRNHKVFLSVGHDEYWSGAQRANVEAARDAGVSLAFFSGNEVYWKTRWEASIDGTATAHRTLVTYKETRSNAKTDPHPEWTGTWRDPRFSTDSRPENALTGVQYQVNNVDMPIAVPSAYAKLRLWRNTSVANLTTGQVATLAKHTLGYESDEDVDNGFRPAGLIRMSETTGPVPEYLQDYGSTVAPGTTTHHLTQYRAPSGALVFGAGTIQWAWGLDTQHDGAVEPVDGRMQQATVNILADMSAQPVTPMSGLVRAQKTTDTTPPVAVITSPPAGGTTANGSSLTVTGTATDTGGQVAGVEVSLDGGATWHPASGTTSWSYTGTAYGNGATSILARAADDSSNVQAQPGVRTHAVTCPCTLFGSETPKNPAVSDTTALEAGVRFVSRTDGWVQGVRFYKGVGNTGTHTGSLWAVDGRRLATGTFSAETATGWQTLRFDSPVAIKAGETFIASYFAPAGRYAADAGYFLGTARSAPPLTAPKATEALGNGVYQMGAGFPTRTFQGGNYWVDVVFTDVDTFPPGVEATTPQNGAGGVSVGTPVSVRFTEEIQVSSLQVEMRDPAGRVVEATISYDAASRTALLDPVVALAPGALHTVSVRAADARGTAMAQAHIIRFRTLIPDPVPGQCPCRLWSDSTQPGVPAAADSAPVTVGTAFVASQAGAITGMSFYAGPGNTGPHVGSLWAGSGALLTQGTVQDEVTSGWRYLTFATPVTVSAGATYVVGYRAPAGRYAYSLGYFGQPYTNQLLKAVGGRYTYGAGAPATSSSVSFWVDVSFQPTVPPLEVTSLSPAQGASSVPLNTLVAASFSRAITLSSLQMGVRDGAGSLVAGTVSYDAASSTATFNPSLPLARGTTYQVSVSAQDSRGVAMVAPLVASFRTVLPDAVVGVCPCGLFDDDAVPAVLDSGDRASVELGVRFDVSQPGTVSGVQFFKHTSNGGTHVGSLWGPAGELLAQATFSGESSSGWQTVTFGSPVTVQPGVSYVVSYRAPSGGYSYSGGAFSGGPLQAGPVRADGSRYTYGSGAPTGTSTANYWVDVIYAPGAAGAG